MNEIEISRLNNLVLTNNQEIERLQSDLDIKIATLDETILNYQDSIVQLQESILNQQDSIVQDRMPLASRYSSPILQQLSHQSEPVLWRL